MKTFSEDSNIRSAAPGPKSSQYAQHGPARSAFSGRVTEVVAAEHRRTAGCCGQQPDRQESFADKPARPASAPFPIDGVISSAQRGF